MMPMTTSNSTSVKPQRWNFCRERLLRPSFCRERPLCRSVGPVELRPTLSAPGTPRRAFPTASVAPRATACKLWAFPTERIIAIGNRATCKTPPRLHSPQVCAQAASAPMRIDESASKRSSEVITADPGLTLAGAEPTQALVGLLTSELRRPAFSSIAAANGTGKASNTQTATHDNGKKRGDDLCSDRSLHNSVTAAGPSRNWRFVADFSRRTSAPEFPVCRPIGKPADHQRTLKPAGNIAAFA